MHIKQAFVCELFMHNYKRKADCQIKSIYYNTTEYISKEKI